MNARALDFERRVVSQSKKLGHGWLRRSSPAFIKATYRNVLPGVEADPLLPSPRYYDPTLDRNIQGRQDAVLSDE